MDDPTDNTQSPARTDDSELGYAPRYRHSVDSNDDADEPLAYKLRYNSVYRLNVSSIEPDSTIVVDSSIPAPGGGTAAAALGAEVVVTASDVVGACDGGDDSDEEGSLTRAAAYTRSASISARTAAEAAAAVAARTVAMSERISTRLSGQSMDVALQLMEQEAIDVAAEPGRDYEYGHTTSHGAGDASATRPMIMPLELDTAPEAATTKQAAAWSSPDAELLDQPEAGVHAAGYVEATSASSGFGHLTRGVAAEEEGDEPGADHQPGAGVRDESSLGGWAAGGTGSGAHEPPYSPPQELQPRAAEQSAMEPSASTSYESAPDAAGGHQFESYADQVSGGDFLDEYGDAVMAHAGSEAPAETLWPTPAAAAVDLIGSASYEAAEDEAAEARTGDGLQWSDVEVASPPQQQPERSFEDLLPAEVGVAAEAGAWSGPVDQPLGQVGAAAAPALSLLDDVYEVVETTALDLPDDECPGAAEAETGAVVAAAGAGTAAGLAGSGGSSAQLLLDDYRIAAAAGLVSPELASLLGLEAAPLVGAASDAASREEGGGAAATWEGSERRGSGGLQSGATEPSVELEPLAYVDSGEVVVDLISGGGGALGVFVSTAVPAWPAAASADAAAGAGASPVATRLSATGAGALPKAAAQRRSANQDPFDAADTDEEDRFVVEPLSGARSYTVESPVAEQQYHQQHQHLNASMAVVAAAPPPPQYTAPPPRGAQAAAHPDAGHGRSGGVALAAAAAGAGLVAVMGAAMGAAAVAGHRAAAAVQPSGAQPAGPPPPPPQQQQQYLQGMGPGVASAAAPMLVSAAAAAAASGGFVQPPGPGAPSFQPPMQQQPPFAPPHGSPSGLPLPTSMRPSASPITAQGQRPGPPNQPPMQPQQQLPPGVSPALSPHPCPGPHSAHPPGSPAFGPGAAAGMGPPLHAMGPGPLPPTGAPPYMQHHPNDQLPPGARSQGPPGVGSPQRPPMPPMGPGAGPRPPMPGPMHAPGMGGPGPGYPAGPAGGPMMMMRPLGGPGRPPVMLGPGGQQMSFRAPPGPRPPMPAPRPPPPPSPYPGLLYTEGRDTLGRPVVVLNTAMLPDKAKKTDVLQYVLQQLQPVVQREYVIVVLSLAMGVKAGSVSSTWAVGAYRSLAKPYRKNVKHIVLVQPSAWARALLALAQPFVSKKAAHKIKKVDNLVQVTEATGGEVKLESLGARFIREIQYGLGAPPLAGFVPPGGPGPQRPPAPQFQGGGGGGPGFPGPQRPMMMMAPHGPGPGMGGPGPGQHPHMQQGPPYPTGPHLQPGQRPPTASTAATPVYGPGGPGPATAGRVQGPPPPRPQFPPGPGGPGGAFEQVPGGGAGGRGHMGFPPQGPPSGASGGGFVTPPPMGRQGSAVRGPGA